MVRRKSVRTRGKLPLSRKFQELKKGQAVAIVFERATSHNVPKRMQGRTGIIEKRIGKAYSILVKDGSKNKNFIIDPIHLKKINQIEKKNDN